MSTYVVSGSASGIGAAVTGRLREAGHTVIGIDLDGAEVSADLATESGRSAAVAAVGELTDRVDGVVPCAGVAGLTAINTVKALRLDPRTGQPLLANRFGGLSGRAVKPIGLRVVAELRDAGITLPIVATGGIRTVDDCREYFWAGADAVSLGSATWLASYPGYALAPLRGLAVRRLLRRVAAHDPRPVASDPSPTAARPGRPCETRRRCPAARSRARRLRAAAGCCRAR